MSLLFHMVQLIVLVFCVFSYLVCGYVALLHDDPALKKVRPPFRFVIWLLSPVLVFDIILEKLFGWSFMS